MQIVYDISQIFSTSASTMKKSPLSFWTALILSCRAPTLDNQQPYSNKNCNLLYYVFSLTWRRLSLLKLFEAFNRIMQAPIYRDWSANLSRLL